MERNRLSFVVYSVILLAIFVYIIKTLKSIFIPLTFAIFLQFLFAPLSRFLETKKIPTFLITIITVIIILISFTLIGSVVYTSVSSFVMDFPKYEAKIIESVQKLIITLELPMEDVTNYLNNKVNWLEIANRLSISDIVSGTMGTFIDFLVKLLLTVAFLVFIMAERNKIFTRIGKVITQEEANHSLSVIKSIENQVKMYVINKSLISFLTGLFGMFFVYLFGIDFIIVSGFLLFILNYIPSLGSIVASCFPILICFIQYGFGWKLVGITLTLGGLQTIMGNFVEPKLMGTELHLSPLIILISLIFWYWVWGPVGMLLAIPIMSAFSLIIKEIKPLKILSAIISEE